MKKVVLYSAFLLSAFVFLNFRFAGDLAEFGISQKEAESKLSNVIRAEKLFIPYLGSAVKTACQSIPAESQAAAVRKLGDVLKVYSQSEGFKKQHNDWVTKSYPQTDALVSEKRKQEIHENRLKDIVNLKAADIEQVVDIQIESGKAFAGMDEMLKSLPADQRAEMKKQIDKGRNNAAFFAKIKPLLKSDFAEFKKQYAHYLAEDQISQEEETLAKRNQSNTSEFERLKNPDKLLALKLTEFLEMSKGVDFAAQTQLTNNRKKFVNPAYEAKNPVWKLCYRSGKVPTETARAYAQKWLAELK
jgi:hypothetical protein